MSRKRQRIASASIVSGAALFNPKQPRLLTKEVLHAAEEAFLAEYDNTLSSELLLAEKKYCGLREKLIVAKSSHVLLSDHENTVTAQYHQASKAYRLAHMALSKIQAQQMVSKPLQIPVPPLSIAQATADNDHARCAYVQAKLALDAMHTWKNYLEMDQKYAQSKAHHKALKKNFMVLAALYRKSIQAYVGIKEAYEDLEQAKIDAQAVLQALPTGQQFDVPRLDAQEILDSTTKDLQKSNETRCEAIRNIYTHREEYKLGRKQTSQEKKQVIAQEVQKQKLLKDLIILERAWRSNKTKPVAHVSATVSMAP